MLHDFQQEVAATFLAMPEADGFALAGGAALIVRGIVDRSTQDLDLFVAEPRSVRLAVDAFRQVAAHRGWSTEIVRGGPSFVRLQVTGVAGEVLVDVAYDYRSRPVVPSLVGPTLSVEDLAADKVLALFGRAEARDFVDVYLLARHLPTDRMLALAAEKDTGFDPYQLAVAIGRLARHPRAELDVDDDDYTALCAYFTDLRRLLITRTVGPR